MSRILPSVVLVTVATTAPVALAQDGPEAESPHDALTPKQWQQIDEAVDRALAWLASRQRADGAFVTGLDTFQPAVTSLCVLAFLAKRVSEEGRRTKDCARAATTARSSRWLDCGTRRARHVSRARPAFIARSAAATPQGGARRARQDCTRANRTRAHATRARRAGLATHAGRT